jgi:hypothetical protein
MQLAQDAAVLQFVGAQGTNLTELGNGFLFRTNISRCARIERISGYLQDTVKAKRVAIVSCPGSYAISSYAALHALKAAAQKVGSIAPISSARRALVPLHPKGLAGGRPQGSPSRTLVAASLACRTPASFPAARQHRP